MRIIRTVAVLAVLTAMLPWSAFAQAPASSFRVGAAKVDITPTQLPKTSEGILDHIYARSLSDAKLLHYPARFAAR